MSATTTEGAHGVKRLRYLKSEGVTVADCSCGSWSCTIAHDGPKAERLARTNLETHLRRYGATMEEHTP